MRRLLAAIVFASACALGPRVNNFPPAHDPQGALAKVTRGRAAFNAELLAVTDSALLVVNTDSSRVVLAPYNAFTTVAFPELSTAYALRWNHGPAANQREQLRLWSRFPTGVDAALLQRLLSAYGQDSLVVLASCTTRGC